MSRTVKIRSRSALPGAGFDASGNPKQGKRKVTGAIAVTSYTSVGESLTPADVGLSTIDFIQLNHENQAASKGDANEGRVVRYNFTTQDFYVRPTGSGTHTLYFVAEGDAADTVSLT